MWRHVSDIISRVFSGCRSTSTLVHEKLGQQVQITTGFRRLFITHHVSEHADVKNPSSTACSLETYTTAFGLAGEEEYRIPNLTTISIAKHPAIPLYLKMSKSSTTVSTTFQFFRRATLSRVILRPESAGSLLPRSPASDASIQNSPSIRAVFLLGETTIPVLRNHNWMVTCTRTSGPKNSWCRRCNARGFRG